MNLPQLHFLYKRNCRGTKNNKFDAVFEKIFESQLNNRRSITVILSFLYRYRSWLKSQILIIVIVAVTFKYNGWNEKRFLLWNQHKIWVIWIFDRYILKESKYFLNSKIKKINFFKFTLNIWLLSKKYAYIIVKNEK